MKHSLFFLFASFALAASVRAQPAAGAWNDRFGSPVDGVTGEVQSVAFGPEGEMFLLGSFLAAGGMQGLDDLVRWDGTGWFPLGRDGYSVDAGGKLLATEDALYLYSPGAMFGMDGVARWHFATESWEELALAGGVRALAVDTLTGSVYAAGRLMRDGAWSENVVRWDRAQWEFVGGTFTESLNGSAEIRALATGVDGALYAGGTFLEVDGTEARLVARWDSTAWVPLAGGLDSWSSEVNTLAFSGSDLFAGGRFGRAILNDTTDVSTSAVARWDGTTWHALGSIPDSEYCNGITGGGVDQIVPGVAPGEVYLHGSISGVAGGDCYVPSGKVARWDGAAWTGIPGTDDIEGDPRRVNGIAFRNGRLLVGGDFDALGGQPVRSAALYEDAVWKPLVAEDTLGLVGVVHGLVTDADGTLYALHHAWNEGGSGERISRWEGGGWADVAGYIDGDTYTLLPHDGGLYVGGDFYQGIGGSEPGQLVYWDGAETWTTVDNPHYNEPVRALAADDDRLFVVTRNRFYALEFDTQTWTTYYAPYGDFEEMLVHEGLLYTSSGGVSVFDPATAEWTSLNLPAPIGAFVVDPATGDLYAGGQEYAVDETDFGGVARWDGEMWYAIGNGGLQYEDDRRVTVSAMAWGAEGLYVTGGFDRVGGESSTGVALWDGSAWRSLSSGLSFNSYEPYVNTMAVSDGSIFAGGLFTHAGGLPSVNIAQWEPAAVTPADAEPPLSSAPALTQNYPNPFTKTTTLEFVGPERESVSLRVYDVLGRTVAVLVEREMEGGRHTVHFDATELSSGVYFVRMTAGDFTETRRVSLIR